LANYPEDLVRAAKNAVDRGIGFLLRAQIQSGPYAGGMPGRIHGDEKENSAADTRDASIRIDYVQHALCAFLRYEKLLHTEKASSPRDASQPEKS
ncbi:MAG TPA: hypothetical protein VEF34_12195, partial [Syntrophobacteraceae bacterium]|nr:hypothetical protein [Syntrophobacteraceae bacterium]